jgi:hypothetical protein
MMTLYDDTKTELLYYLRWQISVQYYQLPVVVSHLSDYCCQAAYQLLALSVLYQQSTTEFFPPFDLFSTVLYL